MKNCNFCGEQIQVEAIKCRFCGEFFPKENIPEEQKKIIKYSQAEIKSKRLTTALVIFGLLFLTAIYHLIMGFIDKNFLAQMVILGITGIVYTPIAFLVYKGYKWSLVVAIILWTVDKGYQLADGKGRGIVVVIFWYLIVHQFFKALKFEYEISGSKNPKKEVEKVSAIILCTIFLAMLVYLLVMR